MRCGVGAAGGARRSSLARLAASRTRLRRRSSTSLHCWHYELVSVYPGVYDDSNHYASGKRANPILSALDNDSIEIVNLWKRVRMITDLEHARAALYGRAST